MNKRFGLFYILIILTVIASLVIAGCSGRGGTGGYSYSGKTLPAPISASNSQQLLKFLFTGALNSPPTESTALAKNVAVAKHSMALAGSAVSKAVGKTSQVEGSVPGTISGTATYSGSVEDDGTGAITISYQAFKTVDGFQYDGKVQLTITAFDLTTLNATDVLMQLTPLTVISSQGELIMQGTIRLTVDTTTKTETTLLNVDGRINSQTESFRLENLTIQTVYDSLLYPTVSTELLTGRIYIGSQGYVDVSQTAPLRYNYLGRFNVDVPDAGGTLLFKGAAGSKARLTPLSISQLKLEVDSNGDGSYESEETLHWSKLAGLVLSWESSPGTRGFDVAYAARETSDGGTISTGFANIGNQQKLDVCLVKTDPVGNLLWSKTFGGTDDDVGWDLQLTSDNGIIIAAVTGSSTQTSSYIIKTDQNGTVLWERHFANSPSNRLKSVRETADGGYILTGSIFSYNSGGVITGNGLEDLYLVRLDNQGNVLWEKRFGGSGADVGWSVLETSSGDFVVTGVSESINYFEEGEQVYLIKTDANGTLLWGKKIGGAFSQYGYAVAQAANGDLVVAGYSYTRTAGNGFYLIRTTSSGSLVWEKTFGNTDSLYNRNDMIIDSSGDIVIAGNDGFNVLLFKANSYGDISWTRTYNWSQYQTMCTASSLTQTSDGGYLVAGSTWPNSGKDFLLIKSDANGMVRNNIVKPGMPLI